MKKSMYKKTFCHFSIIIMLPLLIFGFYSTVLVAKQIQDEVALYQKTSCTQTGESLSILLQDINTLDYLFSSNLHTLSSVLNSKQLDYSSSKSLKAMRNLISCLTIDSPQIDSVYIYTSNDCNRIFTSSNGIENLSTFTDSDIIQYDQNNVDSFKFMNRLIPSSYNYHKHVITSYKKTTSGSGFLVINYKYDYFQRLINNTDAHDNQYSFATDQNDNVLITSSNLSIEDAETLKQQILSYGISKYENIYHQSLYIYKDMAFGWQFYTIFDQKSSSFIKDPLFLNYFLTLLISFIVALILSITATQKDIKQINAILNLLQKAEREEPLNEVHPDIRGNFSLIVQNILKTYIMHSQTKQLLLEKNYQLKITEAYALQSQLNPHFLFNTLETINWQAMRFSQGPNDVSNMITDTAAILRYSLEDPSSPVTISDELENTLHFIEIMQIRYPNRCDFNIHCDESLYDIRVCKFIFQPLLENSMSHGILMNDKKGVIDITISTTEEFLILSVSDNGIGMLPEQLEYLQNNLRQIVTESPEYLNTKHIGLSNLHKRLYMRYGTKYHIEINSSFHLGTTINLFIPPYNIHR